MHIDKKHKKFTVIIIEDERRLCSFRLPVSFFTICLTAVVGLCIIIFAAVLLHNRMGSLREEIAANIATSAKPADTGNGGASANATTATITQSYNLSIEDFQADFDSSRRLVRYSFLLKNKTSKNTPASGYIFLILKSERTEGDRWLADPQTTLSNGVPQNFKDGDPFFISRHKIIAKDIKAQHVYDSAAIFVFSDDGNLVLREVFNLKN